MTPPSDFAPVREGEQIDTPALAAYLRGRLPGVAEGLTVRQFPGGHSNLTYLLEAGGLRVRVCAARRSVRWRPRPTIWRANTTCWAPCTRFFRRPRACFCCATILR